MEMGCFSEFGALLLEKKQGEFAMKLVKLTDVYEFSLSFFQGILIKATHGAKLGKVP